MNGWCVPVPELDEAIVKRSQYHFFTTQRKRSVQYKAYVKLPLVVCIATLIVGIFLRVLSPFKLGRYLLETVSIH